MFRSLSLFLSPAPFSPIFSYLEPLENSLDSCYQRLQRFDAEVGLLAGRDASDHAPASGTQDAVRSEECLGVLVELHSRLLQVQSQLQAGSAVQPTGAGGAPCRHVRTAVGASLVLSPGSPISNMYVRVESKPGI